MLHIRPKSLKIFLMDLWSIVPYYDLYLLQALRSLPNVSVTLGAITYYLDPECFTVRGLKNDPGLVDIVGRFHLPKFLRRALKFVEALINMLALVVRFVFSKPDVIHIQYLPMLQKLPLDFWFLSFAKRRGIKLICTVHDILPHDSGLRYKSTFQRLYSRVDALICHSESIKDRLISEFGVSSHRIFVIPHGPFFYDWPRVSSQATLSKLDIFGNRTIVLWQGIIFPYKGVHFLIDAWKKVHEICSNALLVIAGTGSPHLLNSIRDAISKANITASVHLEFNFLSLDDLTALYQRADVVVYPYKAITTSGALMSGIAFGRTIVATRLPVFLELLSDRKNSILVNYGDVEGLANCLVELIRNPQERERLASGVKALNFGSETWADIALRTLHCYRTVTSTN